MATSAASARVERLPIAMPTWRRKLQFALVLVDLCAIVAALVVAIVVRFGASPAGELSYPGLAAAIAALWIVALLATQSYNSDGFGVGHEEFTRVLRASFFVFGTLAIITVAFKLPVARTFLAIAFPLGVVLLESGRLAMRRFLVQHRQAGRGVDRALVVGAPNEIRYVVQSIQRSPEAGYQVVAVATGGSPGTFELADGSMIDDLGDLNGDLTGMANARVSTLVVAGQSRMSRRQLRELSWRLEDSPARLVVASSMTDVAGPRIHWRPIEGLPLMSVEMPQYNGSKYGVKRLFDVVMAVILLVVFSPLILIVAVAIKLGDRGPVFFKQTRVGVDGTTFKMTKFRSMVVDAESHLVALTQQQRDAGNVTLFKLREDPRVTTVGRFIRRYSIDELPQLFDVLRGTMSLVGPRPPLPSEVDHYEAHVRRRLNVKPGMTGPWQVGGRSNLTWDESVRKDLYYVENWSMSGDIVILLKTVRAVLGRDGAY